MPRETEYTPRDRALDSIVRSIASHQPVKREGQVGSTCRNPFCRGVIFLTLNDRYRHQAVVLANDLDNERDFALTCVRADAEEDGVAVPADILAKVAAEHLVLAPATPNSRETTQA
ncbi:hypothetical protein ACQCSX_22510 (plasmid) [Pseudarthrobacter sp. P1]|uniref:hypothetical protein n=1 Tax=Pseudarthrobacter sp. P1 TaxID=3418418 RepID=UPI003CF8C703